MELSFNGLGEEPLFLVEVHHRRYSVCSKGTVSLAPELVKRLIGKGKSSGGI